MSSCGEPAGASRSWPSLRATQMRIRSVLVVLTTMAAAGCGATGPTHVLNGEYLLDAPGSIRAVLVIGQYGTNLAGYDLGAVPNIANWVPAEEIVCGQIRGKSVRFYLPSDSSISFSGTFNSAGNVVGTVTTATGSTAAILSGPEFLPVFIDGVPSVPTPPSQC